MLIQQEYRALYSKDLKKRLSSELSGNVKVKRSFLAQFFFSFSFFLLIIFRAQDLCLFIFGFPFSESCFTLDE